MEAKRLIGLATQWLLARVLRYDLMLLTIVMCLITVGFITLFSAGYSFPWRIEDQMRNIIGCAYSDVHRLFRPDTLGT